MVLCTTAKEMKMYLMLALVMIEGTVMERRYYQRWKDKQKVQGLFIEMVWESRAYA